MATPVLRRTALLFRGRVSAAWRSLSRFRKLAAPTNVASLRFYVCRYCEGILSGESMNAERGAVPEDDRQAVLSTKRGYYRIPSKFPANRVAGLLAEVVRVKFAEEWPKARIARELRLARRTVIRQARLPRHSTKSPCRIFAATVRCENSSPRKWSARRRAPSPQSLNAAGGGYA